LLPLAAPAGDDPGGQGQEQGDQLRDRMGKHSEQQQRGRDAQEVGDPRERVPEQVEGRPVDGRTDVYSLACAAFEMLSGTPPFKRDQGLAVLWAQLSAAP